MKVLSLFDGMSCGQIALSKLGVKVDKYYASEIDKYAIEITQKNFPDTVQLGDVCNLDPKDFMDVDLLLFGSPCQGFSFAGKQLAFDDPRSALFFEAVRLLKAIKPKYFLAENVRMKKEFLEIFTEQVSACYTANDVAPEYKDMFGNVRFEPHFINSSLLSAQSRQRYYWTNIPNIKQPQDKGIVLRDILENGFESERDKSHCIDANYYKGANVEQYKKKHRRQLVNKPKQVNPSKKASGKQPYIQDRVFHEDGKSHALTAEFAARTNVATKPKQVGVAVDLKGHDQLKRVYSPEGKSPSLLAQGGGNNEPKVITGGAIRGRAYDEKGKHMDKDGVSVAEKTKQMLELRKDEKSNAITTVGKDSVVVSKGLEFSHGLEEGRRLEDGKNLSRNYSEGSRVYKTTGKSATLTAQSKGGKGGYSGLYGDELHWRKLTPLECERLQTVPDGYTEGVSNTQRYRMLGNGWTVDVIAHILTNMIIFMATQGYRLSNK